MGHSMQHYLVSLETREGAAYSDCAGSERLLVFAAALPRGTADSVMCGPATRHVCHTAMQNAGDDPAALDMAVRRFEQPSSARFSVQRVPALLHAANSQLREAHDPKRAAPGERPRPLLPPISAVVLTTWFGHLAVAQAGELAAAHRIRRREVQLMTSHDPSWHPSHALGPAGDAPRSTELGQSNQLEVIERREPLEVGDVFVLSHWISREDGRSNLVPLFEEMARASSFDAALGTCFRSLSRYGGLPLLIGHYA